MSEMTLQQLCTAYGVSRRAVQGYEKLGLVSSTGKNKWGHLLYDSEAQQKIQTIKLYQRMGFTLRQIVQLEGAAPQQLQQALRERFVRLCAEKQEKEELIEMAKRLLAQLENTEEEKEGITQ